LISLTRDAGLSQFFWNSCSLQRTKRGTGGFPKEFQEKYEFSKYLIFYGFMTIYRAIEKMLRSFERCIL